MPPGEGGPSSKEAGKAADVAKAKRSSNYEDLASQYLVTPVAADWFMGSIISEIHQEVGL